MPRLELVEGSPLLGKIFGVKDEMSALRVFLHNLAFALDSLEVREKPVDAEGLLENSNGLDVVGVVLGLKR